MTTQEPLITIGMPIYNEERFLRKTLDSILAQDYKNFELIISDNASEDETQNICYEYAQRDPRIRYFRNDRNIGSIKNFAQVLHHAEGEYFMFAAGHDLYHPQFLSQCVTVMRQDSSIVLCYPQTAWIDLQDRVLGFFLGTLDTQGMSQVSRFQHVLWGLNYCYPIYGLMRTSVVRHVNHDRLIIGPDDLMLAELSLIGSFAFIPEPLLSMRKFDDSGDWGVYIKKIFVGDVLHQSPEQLVLQILQAYLQLVPTYIEDLNDRVVAVLSITSFVMLKSKWLLQRLSEVTFLPVGSAEEKAQIQHLFSHLRISAQSLTDRFYTFPDLTEAPEYKNFPNPENSIKVENLESSATATLDSLGSLDFNAIVFPSWQDGLEAVYASLKPAIASILNHSQRDRMALLIDVHAIDFETANDFLTEFLLETIFQEDLDLEKEPQISLVHGLSIEQWRSLRSKLNARVIIDRENTIRIKELGFNDYRSIHASDLLATVFEIPLSQ
ncbi:hypothetical protein TUMEXPCC7403_01920 [Tumidithrix helvetica PCC 7403]|uniref:glycosyltransferase family 2 protein n=1 Tax=Tumidithrix helvetica TaxID=3457545 RepID=UPI003CBB6767